MVHTHELTARTRVLTPCVHVLYTHVHSLYTHMHLHTCTHTLVCTPGTAECAPQLVHARTRVCVQGHHGRPPRRPLPGSTRRAGTSRCMSSLPVPATPGPEPVATGEAMQDLEARNKLHCHGNEAPWTDFSQDTARLAADVRAAPEPAASWQGRVGSGAPRTPSHGQAGCPAVGYRHTGTLAGHGWARRYLEEVLAVEGGLAHQAGQRAGGTQWRQCFHLLPLHAQRRVHGHCGKSRGRCQQLRPAGNPLSPPPWDSGFLLGLRPDTTRCRAALEQLGAAAWVTHARATLPPLSAVTHGPSLAPGSGRPSRLGACFGRGGGSWARLRGGMNWARCVWRQTALGLAAGGWHPSTISKIPLPNSPSLGQEGKEQKGMGGNKSSCSRSLPQQPDLLAPAS